MKNDDLAAVSDTNNEDLEKMFFPLDDSFSNDALKFEFPKHLTDTNGSSTPLDNVFNATQSDFSFVSPTLRSPSNPMTILPDEFAVTINTTPSIEPKNKEHNAVTFALPPNLFDNAILDSLLPTGETAKTHFNDSIVGDPDAQPAAMEQHEMLPDRKIVEQVTQGTTPDENNSIADATFSSHPLNGSTVDSVGDSDNEAPVTKRRKVMSSEPKEEMVSPGVRRGKEAKKITGTKTTFMELSPQSSRKRRRAQLKLEVEETINTINREVRALETKYNDEGVTFELKPLQPALRIPKIIARKKGAPSLFVQIPCRYAETKAYWTAGVAYENEQGEENVGLWYMWLADYQRKEMENAPVSVTMIIEKWYGFVKSRCDTKSLS